MRDVIKENVAETLLCPIRNGYCYGELCLAWTVSWENCNEGYCAAFRATYEQEIGQGWKKYGRRIMDSRKKLLARLKQAEAERDAALADNATYRLRYGCPACGEQHPPECMCPPHEVRVKGMHWFDGVRKVMTRELHELRGEVKRLREVERLAKAYGAAVAARDERLAAPDKETTPNG